MNSTETNYHFSVAKNNANASEAKASFDLLVANNALTPTMAETLREDAKSTQIKELASKFLEKPTKKREKFVSLFLILLLLGGIVSGAYYFITKSDSTKKFVSDLTDSPKDSKPGTVKQQPKTATDAKIKPTNKIVVAEKTPEEDVRSEEEKRWEKTRIMAAKSNFNYYGEGTFDSANNCQCMANLNCTEREAPCDTYTGKMNILGKISNIEILDAKLIKIKDDGSKVYMGKWKSRRTHSRKDEASDIMLTTTPDNVFKIVLYKKSAYFEIEETGNFELHNIEDGC